MSPSLYNLYTSGLRTPSKTTLAQFADDTSIITSNIYPTPIINTLKKSFTTIFEFYYNWKIRIKENKSKIIYFTKRRAQRFLPNNQLHLNNHKIPWSNSIKYLGIELDKKLTFSKHIEYTKLKALKYIKILYPFINRKSKLNIKNKLLLYKNVFHPLILYASPVWDNCAQSHLNTLQTTQNKILKLILNKPYYYKTTKLHTVTNIQLLQKTISTRTNTFITKCSLSPNTLIKTLPD